MYRPPRCEYHDAGPPLEITTMRSGETDACDNAHVTKGIQ
jgi:hypothetical protein